MGSTKIINILKTDNFEDIFEEFKKTEAEEVIFILPKNSKMARNESHFVSLAGEAQSSQKKLTIMTTDESVKSYAPKYGFRLLADPGQDDDQTQETEEENVDKELLTEIAPELEEAEETESQENTGLIEKNQPEPEEDYHPDADTGEDISEDLIEEKEDDGLADLAMAKYRSSKMSDIRKPSEQNQIKIKRDGRTSTNPRIKKDLPSESLDELESIWLKRDQSARDGRIKSVKNFWDNINPIKREKIHNRTGLIFILSGVVLLFAVLFLFLGSASIIIKPQREKIDFETTVSVSSNYSQTDFSAKKVAGQFLSYSAEVSKDFVATGEKEVARKARGEITVYNNFNSEPQGLVANTRFESPKGLIFRIPRPITIPGAKLVSGKLVPGSIAVEVIADKPGQEYNINADRFTIPGFKGTPKFDGFYAESSKPMAGGIIGLTKVVTEKDFNDAKDQVTKEVLSKALENLKTKTNGFKIAEPINNKVVSLKSTAEIDDATEGFAIAATAEAKTIGFQESDIVRLVDVYSNKNGRYILLENTLEIKYSEPKLDLDKKILSLSLSAKGDIAAKIDEEKMIKEMLGMRKDKIQEYLLSIPEIESGKVVLSPFWVRSIPKNKNNIQLKLVY
ncbi:MAG: hypothetical protein HYT63_03240 [Candidatus Yanofskybacteria bacterium]|nr:hypothetical protein [Candidatus Yanofskybacteria bacterium]